MVGKCDERNWRQRELFEFQVRDVSAEALLELKECFLEVKRKCFWSEYLIDKMANLFKYLFYHCAFAGVR